MKNVRDAGFSRKRGGNAGSGPPLPDPLYCESYRTMDSKKRSHAASGNTPNKPSEKRARDSRRNIRGPLDFSSENVENLENLEPPVNSGGLVSPKIQRRRSGGSPGIKVT